MKTYGSLSMAARNLLDTPCEFLHQSGMTIRLYCTGEQAFQHGQLLAAFVVCVIACHFISERVVAGESGAKNHAGIVAQSVGQSPALRQLRAFARGLIAHDQRDAGVAQGVDARSDRQLGDAVESAHAVGGNAEFLFQIESASAARQLDDVRNVVDGLKRGLSGLALHQARDVFVEHGVAEARGDQIDKLVAPQNAADVGVIENVLGSGQAQRRSSNDDRAAGGRVFLAAIDFAAAIENIGEQAAEFVVAIAVRRCWSTAQCGRALQTAEPRESASEVSGW